MEEAASDEGVWPNLYMPTTQSKSVNELCSGPDTITDWLSDLINSPPLARPQFSHPPKCVTWPVSVISKFFLS